MFILFHYVRTQNAKIDLSGGHNKKSPLTFIKRIENDNTCNY